MTDNGRNPEVSVIVPVYNIGAYLEPCMDSLVNQTFRDFEILLINDGSTDDSAERCKHWAAADSRIRFFDRKNEGVASARNFGVRESRGKYLAFIDPDDWVDLTYLEKLHQKLENTGADFAECDLWRYDNRTGKKIYRSCYGKMGQAYMLREHMIYGPTATYKCMSRRTLWTKHGIHMPDCSFESPAIYALVLALSGRVESIREPLYYYRRFRENSLIENGYAGKDGSINHTLGIEAMEFLISEFKRCGLYDEYCDTLEGVVKYRLNDILAMQFHRRDPEDFRLLVSNYRTFLDKTFPAGHNEKYITWGGYNLNRILTHMNWLHDPSYRFNFSSIASVCSEPDPGLPEYHHKNHYRQMMLERERTQCFWQLIAAERPKYLFMDLIEERFDVLCREDSVITKSDAFDGVERNERMDEYRLLSRLDEECARLWKESASEFIRRLRLVLPDIKIVIVENYLSERIGDLQNQQAFPEITAICEINQILGEYYAWLEQICPDAVILHPADDPLYFTDREYEYGAVPSHLNEIVNQKIAERLESMLCTA